MVSEPMKRASGHARGYEFWVPAESIETEVGLKNLSRSGI